MGYAGGKGKCYPHLLNLMPPHETYIESHLGGGAVMRHKRRAKRQIGVDIDPDVIQEWRQWSELPCELICSDAVTFLDSIVVDPKTLIYADPPYLPRTRKRSRVYRFDYTDEDHERLISCLSMKHCMVMLSGYDNDLYRSNLAGWSRISFFAKTQTDIREETVWMNFEPPSRLHDSTRLGRTFREREVIKRRQKRLRTRIARLTMPEQHNLLEWLHEKLPGGAS